MPLVNEQDTELMRQFKEEIKQWPLAVKVAFLSGRISLEDAMKQGERDREQYGSS